MSDLGNRLKRLERLLPLGALPDATEIWLEDDPRTPTKEQFIAAYVAFIQPYVEGKSYDELRANGWLQ
jgi:hypothetical protein